MRLNLPVTNREHRLPTGVTLVSVTDLKGRIVYCNESFVEVSGFVLDELLGQPHNIIRHPDVPEEAFRDMWETIQGGRPWSAVVKNRRKDGSHYWVVANVTPLSDETGVTGYMSVRTEATRDEIDAAEALFECMRAEQEAGRIVTVLRGGRPTRDTVAGRLMNAFRPDIPGRMLLAMSTLAAGVGGVAWGSLAAGLSPMWPIGAGLALVLGVWALLNRLVVAPIDGLIYRAHRIAACDLTQAITRDRLDRYGELQAALGQITANLKPIVREAREQSLRMCANMNGMARDIGELASRTNQQARDVQHTATSLGELTEVVRRTADSAKQASAASSQAVAVTSRSGTSVEELSRTMESIRDASSRIHEIIKVIDSIAFQTNILALNAAVEAARAGEHGKGFAVVASEVRALAQRTSVAAGEIAGLITETTERIGEGHEKTQAALALMQDAVTSIQSVHAVVDDIDHATGDQLDDISKINAAVANLDEATSANVAFAGRMADATLDLRGLAEASTETVRVFRVDASKVAFQDAVDLRRRVKQQAAIALGQA